MKLQKTKIMLVMLSAFMGLVGTYGVSQAASITFNAATLGQDTLSFNVGGLNLTASTGDGVLDNITGDGLYVGVEDPAGTYVLTFSETIDSIEIEFNFLSENNGGETLMNFATSNGSAAIGYTNQVGTSYDGTTISTSVRNGQGIISFAGPDFTSFSFDHAQQNPTVTIGFVIERVTVNTTNGIQPVPEPSTMLLLGSGLAGLGAWRYRKQKSL